MTTTTTVETITSLPGHSCLKAVQEICYKKDLRKEFDNAMGILSVNGITRLNNGLDKGRTAGIFQEASLEDLIQINNRILDIEAFLANENSRISGLIQAKQDAVRIAKETEELARRERESKNAWIVSLLNEYGATFLDATGGFVYFQVRLNPKGKEASKRLQADFKATTIPETLSEDFTTINGKFLVSNLPSQDSSSVS